MKRIPYRMFFWWLRIVLLCCTVLNVHKVLCETLPCKGRHIASGHEYDGFSWPVCVREIEGQNLTYSECTVWDFARDGNGGINNLDCSNLLFSTDSGGYLSNVQVHPYTLDPIYSGTNLNITFRNINWHYMQFQQQITNMKWCQKMQFLESVDISSELRLSLACDVWGHFTAGHVLELRLDVGENAFHITAHAHLLLKIPEASQTNSLETNLTNWSILVVVDVAHKPDLIVHWPAVPEKFGVTQYNVQLGDSKPEVVDVSSCSSGYCSLKVFGGYGSRNVNVSVQPVHKLCDAASCRSFSPSIMLEFSFPFYFILMIAIAFILCCVIIISSVYYLCCAAPEESPVLLILYDATEPYHCRVVRILAEYLKEFANIHCWLADAEVPLSKSKNASKWLQNSFKEADAVLIVASPMMHPDIRFSLYPNVLYEALPLIAKQKKCLDESESKGRYLVAIPPYCSAEDIPKGLEDLPRILLPQHLNFLVWSLYNQRSWRPQLVCMVKTYMLACWCPGPTSAYKRHGSRLAEALRVAGANQTVVEQPPRTPLDGSIGGTIETLGNPQDHEDDIVSMPYDGFPGNLNRYPLLGGSIISEESTAPKKVVDLDSLPL